MGWSNSCLAVAAEQRDRVDQQLCRALCYPPHRFLTYTLINHLTALKLNTVRFKCVLKLKVIVIKIKFNINCKIFNLNLRKFTLNCNFGIFLFYFEQKLFKSLLNSLIYWMHSYLNQRKGMECSGKLNFIYHSPVFYTRLMTQVLVRTACKKNNWNSSRIFDKSSRDHFLADNEF